MDLQGYIYDYRLGYVREGTNGGFDILGEDGAKARIVALGGYTTPEAARHGKSWANLLYDNSGGSVQIYSGCTDGFTSAQELFMFIRDGILLEPTLALQLSGFYDFAYKFGLLREKQYAPILQTHPFATPRQIAFYEKITSRFGLGNDEVFYGEENHMAASEGWLNRTESLKALCDEFGIEFKSFLQPCAFSPGYSRTAQENEAICDKYALTCGELTDIAAQFEEQYAQVKAAAQERDYITDISHIFNGCENVYLSACHIKDEFLPKITEAIRF